MTSGLWSHVGDQPGQLFAGEALMGDYPLLPPWTGDASVSGFNESGTEWRAAQSPAQRSWHPSSSRGHLQKHLLVDIPRNLGPVACHSSPMAGHTVPALEDRAGMSKD